MTVGLATYVEPILHRAFGSIGVLTARRPYLVVVSILVLLTALCLGFLTYENENDVNSLLISRRGRIDKEKKFYVDNFDLISPVLNSVIVTAKPGVDLLSVEVFEEVEALQKSIREFKFSYKNRIDVSLEQFCFKRINAQPTEPCFQSSILESFREGSVFDIGGEKNTDYSVLFAAKPSYREFNFTTDFARSFIAQTNLNPDSLMLGAFEVDEANQDTITSVQAFQIGFGAKSPKVLKKDGLQYFEWMEKKPQNTAEEGFCPDVTQCAACADALQPTQFAAAGCTFDGSSDQSDSCCTALRDVRNSPCIEVVYERRPEVGPIANPLFTACGLDIVEVAARCANQEVYLADVDGNQIPPVCACLAGATEECTAAAPAFLAENPQYTSTFTNAANGTEEEVAALVNVLINDVGCPEETQINPLCTCLEDVTAETCTSAVASFLEENPDQTDLFTNAATGDPEAVQSVGAYLVEEFNCELPEATTEPPTTAVDTTEAPTSYKARVQVIHSKTDTISKARKLMHEWEKAWREHMRDKAKEFKYINVAWITSNSLNDEVVYAAEAEMGLIVLGYALVLVYLAIFCSFNWKLGNVNFNKLPPGPGMAVICFLVVLFSVAAVMGASGYISAVTSFKISFITIQMIPLLMLGLGVNDFFVLCSALKTVLLREGCPQTTVGIMYEAISVGGTSITLSSAANACAFSLGTLSPVPIVIWFSTQMAIGVVIAYIVSITAIPSLLSLAVNQYLEGKPDIFFALIGMNPNASPEDKEQTVQGPNEGAIAAFIREYRWPLTGAVFAVFAVWMGFAINGMVHFKQGLDISKAVVKKSHSYDFLVATRDYFDTVQIDIVFEDSTNYSDPEVFQAARDAEFEYVTEGYHVEKQLMATSWLEFYTQYVEEKFCSNEICMNEVAWYYDGFSSAEFGHPSKNICADLEKPEECPTLCANHCPQGPVDSQYRCEYIEDSNQCYCPYRPMLKAENFYDNPKGFDSRIKSYWADFIGSTFTGMASRTLINLDPDTATKKNPFGIPKASRSFVFTRGLPNSVPRQLDHIKKGRDILDHQEIDVYPFEYVIFGQGEQYEDLALSTIKAVGISMAVATVVMMPLIAHWFAAVIVSVTVLLSVLLTAGTTSWTELNMDYSAYVAFIVAVGLSVEFCAHIARDFMLSTGDRMTRVLHAYRTMGVAVFNGSITTFLGIFPSAISELPAIRDRLFVQYSCVVLTGTFAGLFLLPTILSLIGPPSYMAAPMQEKLDKENQKEAKKEKEVEMH